MNILYIGPYRQIDYVGQMANLHIDSIRASMKNTDKLSTRPIYFDPSLASPSSIVYDTENTQMEHIDVTVQYVPIDFVAIRQGFKNLAVPMIDPKLQNISQDYSYDILNSVDKIILDDDKNKTLIKNYGITAPIEMYEEKIIDSKKQKFNLDTINKYYKFGFIGQYRTNKQIIQKIIHAFFLYYRNNTECKLYFFLRGSDQEKIELDQTVSQIKKDLNIPEYINCINSIFGLWNQEETLAALSSINCYISLNDDYRYLAYEKFFINSVLEESGNRFLISRQNIDCIETPIVSLSSSCEYNNSINSVHTQDLYRKISNAPNAPIKRKKAEYSSLGSIVCKQTL